MRHPVQRRTVLKTLFAAAAAGAGLSGCGGGGGDSVVAPAPPVPIGNGGPTSGTGSPPAPPPAPSPTPAPTPAPPAPSPAPTPSPTPAPTPAPAPAASAFSAAWTTALLDCTASLPGAAPGAPQIFDNQTLRVVVRLSLGGDTLRLKLSNVFGTAPVTFSNVHVARTTTLDTIDPATDRAVTLAGQAFVTLAAGTELFSDPVALPVAALSNIAVSMYFAGHTVIVTDHPVPRQTGTVGPGNQVSVASVDGLVSEWTPYCALAAVETSSTEPTKVVVAFGDSQTDGYASTADAARRYPDLLDNRLKAAGFTRTGVVNAGISGNRWIHDYAGPSGSSRFDHDVLNVDGVTHTIILMGINDIGFSVDQAPSQEVSAQQIITAIDSAVGKARARGIKVVLGTLLPFKGVGAGYYSDAGEAKRQAVNAWIRANSVVDGVVDFDQVMRNPADPLSMNPAYNSGDWLHPNDAGYAAMAAAVDLAKLQ